MSASLHLFYQRIISSLASRLPAGSPSKQLMVESVLGQLEDVAYSRLRDSGFRPGCVIDIGAHVGRWTKSTKVIFPDTPFLMIEARDEMRSDLERTAAKFTNVEFRMALLGPGEIEAVTFHRQGSASSLYRERSDTPMVATTIPMTTLDKIVPGSVKAP